MKKRVINIPFTIENDNKSKKIYKLKDEKYIGGKIFENKKFIKIISNMLSMNKNNNSNNIKYIKASDTKEYYKSLKK